jgi:plastin-1
VSIDQHPELVTLLEENEDLQMFMKVAPEVNLLRWFNYHLKRAGHPRRVNNFSKDIQVSI